MSLELLPYIFTRRYDDEMIVCNTRLHSIFILNDVAADIVSYIEINRVDSIDDLFEALTDKFNYDIERNSVKDFIDDLKDCNIILSKDNNKIINNQQRSEIEDYDNQVELEFQDKLAVKNQLYSALIELTYKCNLKCVHCYALDNDNRLPDLTTSEIFDLLDQLNDNNVFRVILTGGELFLRKDILSILEYAYNKRFLVDIFSNGTLPNESMIAKISSFYPRSFQVSLYSHIPEKHDEITGVYGSFDKTIETLKLFKRYGVAINIKSVLMESNYGDYQGLYNLSKNIGASFQASVSIIPRNNGKSDNLSYRIKNFDTMKNVLIKNLIRLNQKSFYRKRNDDEQICGMCKSGISIDPCGNIYPCNLLKIKLGNIKSDKLSDLWSNSNEVLKLRNLKLINLEKCKSCDNINYCVFCPGSALAETGDMLSPYKEACFIAETRRAIDK